MHVDELEQRIDSAEAAYNLAHTGLLRVEIGRCDVEQLAKVAGLVRAQRGLFDAVEADIARREEELGRVGNDRAVSKALDPKGQQSSRGKKKIKSRGEVLDAFPGMDDATRAGEITGEYADAVAKATGKLTEAERAEFNRTNQDLHEKATSMSLHAFGLEVQHRVEQVQRNAGLDLAARQRRNRRVNLWVDLEGMYQLSCALHPELGARVAQAVNDRVDAMRRARRDDTADIRSNAQLVADAIAELILAGANGTGDGAGRTELLVLIDLQTLLHGLHDESVHEMGDGTPLPVAAIRRLACDAEIIPVVLSGDGVPLDVGRAQRFATKPQRRGLRAVYSSCAFGDCDIAFDRCEVHHVDPWAGSHGHTNFDLLVPLCEHHHHQVHDRNWTLTINPANRDLTVTYPDGTSETFPLPRRRPPPGDALRGDPPAAEHPNPAA